MKKSNLFVSALTASMLLLAGCGEKAHEHVDTDPKDHICDDCGEELSQCVDENRDHLCDYCGKEMSQHVDTDPKDHTCDYCGKEISQHTDADPKDHVCDYCGAELSQHTDADPKDHFCDYCGAELSQHVDTDPEDLVCDYCGAELDGIKEVKITSKRSYIGTDESFKMSGEAVVSGAITNSDVTFSTESNLVGLEQAQDSNEVRVTAAKTTGEAVIKATSKLDSSKDKEITIAVEAWSTTSKNRMSSYSGVLEGYNLPYFRTMKDLIKGGTTSVTGQVDLPEYEEAVQALVDGGYAKVEREEKVFYVMNHPTKFGFDVEVEIQGVEIDDPEAGYYNFIASLQPRALSEFPAEAVKAVVDAGTESTIPMPSDGTEFMILRNDGALIEVKLNGDPAAFISSLESANYYINRDNSKTGYTSYVMTCSPERTLLVHVSVADGYYTITYTNQTVPTKSAWTSSESSSMESAFGYVPPFVNVGLSWSSTKKVLTTSRVEAYDMIVAAYKASSDFEWQATKVADSQGNQYDAFLFSHALSEY
ncbi:MAG: zinc ribbon domain-containing protein, partial [bacterium]|nr:zinc ribbon domain-containing protein [bacterium]